MKYLQSAPIGLFFLVIVYFAIFNWSVFTVSLSVSLGFGLITVPLVATVFLVGLVFLGLQTGLTYFVNLRVGRERRVKESELGALKKEKEMEISRLKASFYEDEALQIRENTERIAALQSEMEKVKEALGKETGASPEGESSAEGDAHLDRE